MVIKEYFAKMKGGGASPREKTQALKDLEKLRKTIMELDEYERDTLYPLATRQLSMISMMASRSITRNSAMP